MADAEIRTFTYLILVAQLFRETIYVQLLRSFSG